MANFPKEDAPAKTNEVKHHAHSAPVHNSSSKPASDDETISIPIGALRDNPWIIATFVLAIALIVIIFMKGGIFGSNSGVGAIGEDEAAAKLITFINSQGKGEATLVSSVKEDSLYKVTVSFDGQEIPVFISLDGKYLIPQTIPLSNEATGETPDNSATEDKNPEVVVINVNATPVKGKTSASVVYIEFSDYECPFCGRHVSQTNGDIVKNYADTGKIKMYFKDYPLDFHPSAFPAAKAARCVRDQKGDDGYWKMHDKLYANQQDLNETNYVKWAKESGADTKKFSTCFNSTKFDAAIKSDLAYGQSVGIQGTPGFIIVANASKVNVANVAALQVYQGGDYMVRYVRSADGAYVGVRMSGALPYSEFKKVLDVLTA